MQQTSLRAIYTDLDGSMLGLGGALLRDADGHFSLAAVQGLGSAWSAGVEVPLMSGRREQDAAALARLCGLQSYICEAGAVVVIDGDRSVLAGDWTSDREAPAEAMRQAGVHDILFEAFPGRLEWHTPWGEGRLYSLILRGQVPVVDANALLAEHGLELVDNGTIEKEVRGLDTVNAYHVVPFGMSKASAVAFHMRARGYGAGQTVAVGNSAVDLRVASVVGHCYMVANAAEDPALRASIESHSNATLTQGRMGDGFAEAVSAALLRDTASGQ